MCGPIAVEQISETLAMIPFTKMHSLGNDFILLDGVRKPFALNRNQIRRLADRRTGIGCDQVIVVEPARKNDVDFFMRIFNTDGSEAGQCGNGARCFAKFLHDEGLTTQLKIKVETPNRLIQLEIEECWQVIVDMGPPLFGPAEVPFHAAEEADIYTLEVADEIVELSAISMGNPHAVLLVDEINTAPVSRLGPAVENHPRFPEQTNVGFARPTNRRQIQLRVWERGVGETRACGSGACAAAVVCHRLGQVDDEIDVVLPGGTARVRWSGEGPVFLSGPATTVYQGEIDLATI